MIQLYNTILYQPIFNLLIFFYNIIPGHDIGLAILALTILVKVILLPFGAQMLRSQKALQELQPKLTELKEKYKNDKEKLASETMQLYKTQHVNPLSSCLPLLIQFPFLIAVYQSFQHGIASQNLGMLYSFVANPGHINNISFGFIDMAAPSLWLAVLAGVAQYIQTKMLITTKPPIKSAVAKDEQMMASMNKSMQYFMPLLTIIIGMQLPSGLTFYWLITTILTVLQQRFIFRVKKTNAAPTVTPSV
ncbi:MAG: YidC/Oxa1 family membrane protein insertase [Parcubacteria group bacterium]